MTKPDFIGVVMAGGQSRRMGTNKALLKRDGMTMAEFTRQCLLDAGATNVFFSMKYNEETSSDSQTQTDLIADLVPNLGPLGSIQAALTYVSNKNLDLPILFVPVDLPLLNKETLTRLASYHFINENAVSFHRQPLPLLIKPSVDVLKSLNQVIEQNENLSIFHFLDKIGADAIRLDHPDALFNSNRPEEWQKAMGKIKTS